MKELDIIVSNAFDKYMTLLQYKGKGSSKELHYIMTADIINNILSSDLIQYATEEDLKIINQSINCIQFNSCFVDLYSYKELTYINLTSLKELRITEEGNLRSTDTEILRVKS